AGVGETEPGGCRPKKYQCRMEKRDHRRPDKASPPQSRHAKMAVHLQEGRFFIDCTPNPSSSSAEGLFRLGETGGYSLTGISNLLASFGLINKTVHGSFRIVALVLASATAVSAQVAPERPGPLPVTQTTNPVAQTTSPVAQTANPVVQIANPPPRDATAPPGAPAPVRLQ